ncbi:protein kinase domain-containing protein [Hyalangium versicolor]|uniref:protein kinase domain-containing protein n=1 Tax=Hyalangium versicolor TaxID=2861190 RepID=UPI001CCE0CD2|nr:protein kinase [Hyalangium versicolor]
MAVHLTEVKGKVDFGIITIREDEFEAVLQRFPEAGRVSGQRQYNLRRVELTGGASYLVAVLRCIEQGNGEAQSAAHDLLEDLNPQWLLVVGIAGGVPSDEFGLGDVVVSTWIHDFNVEAVLHDRESKFALAGGPVAKAAAVVVANFPAQRAELGNWGTAESIEAPRPAVLTLESLQSGDWLYGDEEWRGKVRQSLSRHAGRAEPLVTVGAIASSDRLIKDMEILKVWMKMARQILAVEMESAGAYRATYGRSVPTLSIRGISDLVGLKRDPAWTQYACHTAAAFALALLRTRPVEPRGVRRNALPEYADEASRKLSEQIAEARQRKVRLQAVGADTTALDQEILGLRRQLREGGQLREGDSLGDGRYLLLRRVGRGGFATVWEAHDELMDQPVAIKVLHSDLSRDPMRRERFFRGARVMSELAHPAIVKVLEPQGQDGGFYYFVMEFISGGDFRAAVLSGKFPSEAVIPLVLQVGDALALAHKRNFVHRDIKPANILLDEKGTPRLTDFDLVGGLDTTGGTKTGALGTFLYAAPELMDRPQDAGARADVYGLGMTVLFGLYGREFSLDVIQDTEKKKLISRLPCNPEVRKVIQRAVSRAHGKRYPNASKFCSALEEAHRSVPPSAVPPSLLPTGTAFEVKVTWNQHDPILKLPSRTAMPGLPFGELTVQVPDGGMWQFRMMKEYCNVAKPVGTDSNRLPGLLRRWFGPRAGHPGTAFRVRFTSEAGGWKVAPIPQEGSPQSRLKAVVAFPSLRVAAEAAAGANPLEDAPGAEWIRLPLEEQGERLLAMRAPWELEKARQPLREGDWLVLRRMAEGDVEPVQGDVGLVKRLSSDEDYALAVRNKDEWLIRRGGAFIRWPAIPVALLVEIIPPERIGPTRGAQLAPEAMMEAFGVHGVPTTGRHGGLLFLCPSSKGPLLAPDRIGYIIGDRRPAETAFVLTSHEPQRAWRYWGVARWSEDETCWLLPEPVDHATWRELGHGRSSSKSLSAEAEARAEAWVDRFLGDHPSGTFLERDGKGCRVVGRAPKGGIRIDGGKGGFKERTVSLTDIAWVLLAREDARNAGGPLDELRVNRLRYLEGTPEESTRFIDTGWALFLLKNGS